MSMIDRLEGQRYARDMLEGLSTRDLGGTIASMVTALREADRPADYKAGALDTMLRMQFEAAYRDWVGVSVAESARLGDSYRLPKLAQAWHWFKVGAGHV